MLLQFCEMETVAISLIVCQIFVLGWRRAVWDINEWRKFSHDAVSAHLPDV